MKKLQSFYSDNYLILQIITFAACLYIALPRILFRLLKATNGIDPAWNLTMNTAIRDGLIFGQDIVFTFGPLAHLFTGNPIFVSKIHFFIFSTLR